jgi:hypothetical protein
MNVTQAEHAAMSWHQRQTLNQRLRAETVRLTAELEKLNTPRVLATLDAGRVQEQARAILADLPADPLAAQHRLDVYRELKARARNKRKDSQ